MEDDLIKKTGNLGNLTKSSELKYAPILAFIVGLSRCFTARGFSSRDPTKSIRLISSRVTKLPPKI